MMPTILIAEDQSVVRLGTIILIKELYPDAEIREVQTFDEVLKHLSIRVFDLLILDIHIPGGDNLQMVEAVQMRQPDLPILIFSAYDEHLYALRYLQAGALGYLQKETEPENVKLAIKKVLNKERYISDKMQHQLLDNLLYDKSNAYGNTNALSNREMEVMNLLIKGHSPSEIKIILNIQSSTISTYKERIFGKMNVSNVMELAEKIRLINS